METPAFRDEPLSVIARALADGLRRRGRAEALVPDPDLGAGLHAGERVEVGGRAHVHRSWRTWIDLADRLEARLLTPERVPPGLVRLALEALPAEEAPTAGGGEDARERYGAGSPFGRVHKLEEGSALDYLEALERALPPAGGRVLALGANRGDELLALARLDPARTGGLRFVAVDHAASALAQARARFPEARHRFVEADLGRIAGPAGSAGGGDALGLGRFDLVLALSVLQSPGVDDRALVRALVQRHLAPGGALILSLPNGRYRGGELVYGARVRNLREPELGLVVRDLAAYRRYLHQHRFRVYVTGKRELFLTAVPEGGRAEPGG